MEKRVSPLKLLLCAIGTVLVCAVLGYLLLVLCYALSDPARQKANVASSALTLAYEDIYPSEPFSRRTLDNYTDSLMLLMSSHVSDESAFVRAEEGEYWTCGSGTPYDTLDWLYNQGEEPTGIRHYRRYWHGYQLTLRPLLHVMDYRQIRNLNSVVQMLLLALAALLLQRKQPHCLIPFLFMSLLLGPTAIARSLQFSSVHYIMLAEIILLLWNPGGCFRGPALLWLFLLGGIATGYFDFLTAPTLTLTVPLILACADRERCGAERGWSKLLCCCVFWGLGYAGMWGCKWLLSMVMTRGAFLEDLLQAVRFRSSTGNGARSYSRLGTLNTRFWDLFQNRYQQLFVVAYAAAMPLVYRDRLGTLSPGAVRERLVFVLPLLCAVGWIFLLCNHSAIHGYTYRTLAPCIFAAMTAVTPKRTAPPK